jgi:hypothetical protein
MTQHLIQQVLPIKNSTAELDSSLDKADTLIKRSKTIQEFLDEFGFEDLNDGVQDAMRDD